MPLQSVKVGGEAQGLNNQAPRHTGHSSQGAERTVQPTDKHTEQPTASLALVQMRFSNKQHLESQHQQADCDSSGRGEASTPPAQPPQLTGCDVQAFHSTTGPSLDENKGTEHPPTC